MKKSTAETWVKVFSVLSYVSGGFLLLISLAAILGLSVAGDVALELGLAGSLVFILLAAVVIVLLILAALEILIGWGLWTYRNWARILLLVFAYLSIVWSVTSTLLTTGGSAFDVVSSIGVSIVTIAISALQIWLFQFSPSVVKLFK